MYEIAFLGTIVLMSAGTVDYIYRAWIHKSNPALATWIIMEVMILLSFWMYWESPEKSWSSNIGVTGGMIAITVILAGVMAANIRHDELRVAFGKVQKWCLAAGGATVVLWSLTDDPFIYYILVQVIGVVAYIPTVKKLWRAERSTEPLFLWIALLIAFILAIYPAWLKKDLFAWIYLGRTIPTTLLLIWIIIRVKQRMRQRPQYPYSVPGLLLDSTPSLTD